MSLIQSSIGRKMIMGICGGVWAVFVLTHMAANFLIPFSAEAYNRYSHAIISNKLLLYGAEGVLLISVIVHAALGIWLTIENKKAAPQKYAVSANPEKRAFFGSKTMAYHGTVLLFFIIYHLITFKYGPEYTVTYNGVEMRDLHRLVIEVFQSPGYVAWYIACLILLGIHLSHGVSSLFQTLGLNQPSYTPKIRVFGRIYAVVIAAGFMVPPIYAIMM